jgi:hypothetical protein
MTTERSYQWLWIRAFMWCLAGYALGDKTFAYFFLGELAIVIGFGLWLRSGRLMVILSDSVLLFWFLFAVWGFLRTVPFLHKYRFDAVRDAVLWGYGLVAVYFVVFLNSSDQISRILRRYRAFLRWYLIFVPIILLVWQGFSSHLPTLPWARTVRVMEMKPGDAAVHLAGAALFLLIFPVRAQKRGQFDISLMRVAGVVGWIAAALLVAATTRGGFLALSVPIAMVCFMRPQKLGIKVLAISVAVLAFVLLALELNPFTIHLAKGKVVDLEHITESISSIGGGSSVGHEDTTQFRLVWWGKIIHYTIFGPYRWTGKGFGVNLATSDGPPGLSSDDVSLRSPHNVTMTVLARMGLPGLFLWLALLGTFFVRLISAYRKSVSAGSMFWSGVYLWIIGYWMAAFINGSFDVYIEGPQGGVWFWSVIGFGVAAMRIQAYEMRRQMNQRHAMQSEAVTAGKLLKAV